MRKCKVFLTLLFAVGLFLSGKSQSSYDIINSTAGKGTEQVNTNQISVNNFWFGSKLSYDFDKDNSVGENFALTGRILYVPASGTKWALPIVITASTTDKSIISDASGYNFSVNPYYKLYSSPTTTLLAHGAVAYKALNDVQQIRVLGGLEVALSGASGGSPVTISATPVYTHSTGPIGSKTFLEVTGIIPVAKSLGALIEWQSGTLGGIKGGIIVNVNAK